MPSSSVFFRKEKKPEMGSVGRQDGVLKLVRRGRYVEVYTQPLTAAEVLEKYPRHSITRPDFFEYPLVVVRPEAILNLGKVFFIVPNHTVYKLMKEHRLKHPNSPSQNLSTKNSANQQQAQKKDSPRKVDAGSTPKHQNRHQLVNYSPPSTSCICLSSSLITSSLDQDRDLRSRKHNKVGSWPDAMSKHTNTLPRLEQKTLDHEDHHTIDSNITADFPETEDENFYDIEFKHGRHVTPLKSCIKKPDSGRKSLQLKVTFLLASEDEEERRIRISRQEFAGYNSYRSLADFFPRYTSLIST